MMRFMKYFKSQSEFSRNVLTLMVGTSVAQAIPIVITPILTRIYSPEDFGLFALYFSIVTIISAVINGRYDLAIILQDDERDALNIVILCLLICSSISTIALILVYFFNEEITKIINNKEISIWLYFIPVSVFLSGIYQIFSAWYNREKKYKILSGIKVVLSAATASFNLILGWIMIGIIGLVVGNIFGLFFSVVIFIIAFYIKDMSRLIKYFSLKEVFMLAKKYKNFPIYDFPAALLNITAHHSVHIFFNIFFGATVAGYYFLIQRVLSAPIILIASAMQDVFKEKISKVHNAGGDTRKLYVEMLKKLIIMSIVPVVCIFFFVDWLVVIFFGESWAIVALYIKILLPAFFLRFISFPLSFIFYIAGKQYVNLLGQFFLFLGIIFSFYFGYKLGVEATIIFISISNCLFYFIYLILSYGYTSNGKSLRG